MARARIQTSIRGWWSRSEGEPFQRVLFRCDHPGALGEGPVSRVAPGDGAGCRTRAPGGRSPLRSDCAAVLAGAARGRTHFTHCVRFVQTGGRESDVGSGLRPPPRLLRSSPPTSCPRPTPHPATGGSGGVGGRGESWLLEVRSLLAPRQCVLGQRKARCITNVVQGKPDASLTWSASSKASPSRFAGERR